MLFRLTRSIPHHQQFPTLTLKDKGEFKGAELLQASSDNHVAKEEDLHGHIDKKISVASHVAKVISLLG